MRFGGGVGEGSWGWVCLPHGGTLDGKRTGAQSEGAGTMPTAGQPNEMEW